MGDFSAEVGTSFPSQEIKTMLNIRYTANFLASLSETTLKPYGISSAQYNILRILRGAKEPITMNVVKDRMLEKSPNTTRLTDKLCAKKLIERVRCEHDRRAVYVSITVRGLDLLENVSLEILHQKITKLTSEEQTLLNTLLDKIRG